MRKSDREQAPFRPDVDAPASVSASVLADPAVVLPKPSPMMAQYHAIKADHPDALLFYRMGDFYELFFADAERAAATLGIALTRRGRHEGADIPMCGVPVERHEDYLHRLIRAGHRVAICEQMEDPAEAKKRGGKSVVARAVVRLVTPGTLTEERLLEPATPNWLVALARVRDGAGDWRVGLAAVDISTGAFAVVDTGAAELSDEIGRFAPREIVVPDALAAVPDVARALAGTTPAATRIGREPGSAERRLADWFGLATLDGLGPLTAAEIAAAATAVFYLDQTQCGARPRLEPPQSARRDDAMEIDSATRANLELTQTLTGAREGSLLAAIDRCATPAGSRLLAARLVRPLLDSDAIADRHGDVAYFVDQPNVRSDVQGLLRRAPDMRRALARLALARAGPRELRAVAEALQAAAAIADLLGITAGAAPALPAGLVAQRDALRAGAAVPSAVMLAALDDTLPPYRRDGGFIRAGVDAELDRCRQLRDDSRQVVAALQGRYCDDTGVKRLKIKHNAQLGYYVEVPQPLAEPLLATPLSRTFAHRQTMVDAVRFSTVELGELEGRIAAAADEAIAREQAIFDGFAAALLAAGPVLDRVADALAAVDVAAGLATLAAAGDWVKPHIERGGAFTVVGGRHPVVEQALRVKGEPFVSNDCDLSATVGGGRIAVITGPNMAGKSTFLRQNALIAVLAQIGSFVPARAATLGLVDRLFSRVGAADDLARGRSTFMVEMVETAAILNRATASSLVILDEIGRGTATFDGLSIAWAVMEHLHERNRARAIFATHYHELTQLARRLDRVVNLTTCVADYKGDVIFLHEVVAGAADRSYGIQVAKLAGLPSPVIRRARALLAEFEAGDRGSAGRVGDLPLFAAVAPTASVAVDELSEALDAIEPDELSPKDALAALYRLKALRDERGPS